MLSLVFTKREIIHIAYSLVVYQLNCSPIVVELRITSFSIIIDRDNLCLTIHIIKDGNNTKMS